MMNRLVIFLATLTVISCASPTGGGNPSGGGGANANRVLSGTIQVADAAYWPIVKIGLFSGGSAGTYPSLNTDDNWGTVNDLRLVYKGNWDASAVEVSTLVPALMFTSQGATSRAYSLELPMVPGANIYYYLAAWYDGDGDGKLDAVDSGDAELIDDGEFNRVPTKATLNIHDQATTIAIQYLLQSKNLSMELNGKYKYQGYDDDAYNEQLELDASTNKGFNFAITADSGW